ncbi:hypothetical protein IT774_02735 [Salinimonas marina]|uniref:Uncharacterized protein n=1 Tax=Salinimonas marina TaxID=2785918 RepID=A0A7S9DYV5_9ALTE|nr:hypothetical protein [Salinimonas marina]QPG06153.1 hypothetical protein IT774_02735 [Salinimonas marina]
MNYNNDNKGWHTVYYKTTRQIFHHKKEDSSKDEYADAAINQALQEEFR